MRAIVTALFLALVAVPVAQAQQTSFTTPAPERAVPRAEVVAAPAEVKSHAPARLQAVETRRHAPAADAARQISARSVLAIIGAVVVAVALISLFS